MSSQSARKQDKLSFRTFVLLLKRQNPSWTASNIADFLEQSDNPPNLNRHSLMNKIHYLLKRGSTYDRKRSGRPRTTTTPDYRNTVLQEIQTKTKASIRSVSAKLRQNGWKTSPSSVYRTEKSLGLKWFKKKRVQKLTIENKMQRVRCAKILRKNFGATKRSKTWRWDKVVNTDFSGKFILDSSSNPHNDGVWAKAAEEIPPAIYYRSKNQISLNYTPLDRASRVL
ncbi:unnamed protein product [Rotaria sp. Silwood1]|nr:unnamed protein product [Rotaria sp. Silwood1]CAF1659381.1 unnamed protein product [Rotaria sp. Silwood1]